VDLKRLVPMVEVRSVTRSIAFYAKLGFEVGNTFVPTGATEPSWAWLRNGEADLMVAAAEAPASGLRPVLLYLYCPDVAEARKALEAAGVECGAVQFPFYAPGGEFEVRDPDAYVLMITHT
jgi:catechol 2,3-dioxygenase-like lactoylglutathione lyase family enzyme